MGIESVYNKFWTIWYRMHINILLKTENIIIQADVVDDMMQLDVQDNGIGIVHEDQSRVFERFFRGEDPLVLATSGTGLGLSIVKHLVEMHAGYDMV